MTNEHTGNRAAAIAGKLLELKLSAEDKAEFAILMGFPWANVRTVCASCLTQTEDWRLRRGGKKPTTTKGGVEG